MYSTKTGKTRNDLAKLFRGAGVEIGVERGLFSEEICRANPGVKLSSIDPWTVYEGYRDHKNQRKLDAFAEEARARLGRYKVEVMRTTSAKALELFQDESLDFAYIDGNHANPWVSDDIFGWYKKLKRGGILAGHDYTKKRRGHANDTVEAVKLLMKTFNLELTIWDGDPVPSWSVVKP